MTSTSRILAVVLAVAIVGQPMMAPAMAANNPDSQNATNVSDYNTDVPLCSDVPPIMSLMITCQSSYGVVTGNAEETHWAIYSQATIMQESLNRELSEDTSFTNMSQSEMQVEAKKVIIQELNNGSTLTEAKLAAKQRVNEIASEQQKSMWASQNERALGLRNFVQTISEQEGLTKSDVFSVTQMQFDNTTVSTWDGEQITVQIPYTVYDVNPDLVGGASARKWTHYTPSSQPDANESGNFYDGGNTEEDYDAWTRVTSGSFQVYTPQDSGEPQKRILDASKEKQKYKNLNETRIQVRQNAENIAEQIYRNYEPGEISVKDVMSASEMAEDMGSENAGHYSWAAIFAAKRGYATDVGTAMEIDYTTNNSTSHYTGLIYADPSTLPNSTVKVGETYNMAQLDGNVWMSYESGSGSDIMQLAGNSTFTVTSMTDATTGEQINQTTFSSSKFATTDTSDLTQQINRLQEIRDLVEARNDAQQTNNPVVPGGWGDTSSTLMQGLFIGLVAVAGLGVLLLFNLTNHS